MSPLPQRRYPAYEVLTQRLLGLGTFAERLTYLFTHESTLYFVDDEPVTEPDEIWRHADAGTPGFRTVRARVPLVAEWVRSRTGLSLRTSALHNFIHGRRTNSRPAIETALAEFWRIDHRLLDPTVGAAFFVPPANPAVRRVLQAFYEAGFVEIDILHLSRRVSGAREEDLWELAEVLDRITRSTRGRNR